MSNLYEIVELDDGEIILRRVDGEGEPLLAIRFSDESRAWMQQGHLAVARAMIEAGVEAFAELEDEDEDPTVESGSVSRRLH